MLAIIDTPEGVNAPSLPAATITWRRFSQMWSATSAERAFIGPYELIAFDIPPAGPHPRIIAWELHAGPQFMTGIAGAPADSFESAKTAAEQEVRRLLAETAPEPNTAGVSSRIIPACVNGLPNRGPQPKAHPDAVLLAAWEGYVAAYRAYGAANEAVPGGLSDTDAAPFTKAYSAFGGVIERTPARTMAGVALQLRYLFEGLVESPAALAAAIYRKVPSEGLDVELEDARYRMLWRMIEEAEQASAGQPAA